MSNREIKSQLKILYGSKCMLTDLQTNITYHHLLKKCDGGQPTKENGALLNTQAHSYLHKQECKNRELYEDINECLQLYKQCLELNKTECLETWQTIQELARVRIKVRKE